LTDNECGQLCAFGVRTIVDLRRPYEIQRDGRIRETPGLAYHNIHPIHREWEDSEYVPEAGPARYLADRYLDMAVEGAAGLGEALRLIADPASAPVVIHCFAGKDRTGVLSALTLSLLGVYDDDIAADYARSEQAQAALSALVRAESADRPYVDPPAHFVACPPEAMLTFPSAELIPRGGGPAQATRCTQPCRSATRPRWMSTSSVRSRSVTSPAVMVNSPSGQATRPIGVITAAVPQANASRRRPLAASARHSSNEYGRSTTVSPWSRASVMTESRVMPGRMVPVSAGVTRVPSS
jgi:hypothetical protein